MRKKAIAYVRQRDERQQIIPGENDQHIQRSLDFQEREIREYCKENHIDLIDSIRSTTSSIHNKEEADYLSKQLQAKSNEFDMTLKYLLFTSPDRLTRSHQILAYLLDKLREQDIELKSVNSD